jgi:tRNA(fMet)-specific endonuclease VapC
MLDTDSVSFFLRGRGHVVSEMLRRPRSEVCVSAITIAELRYGAARRKSSKLDALIDKFVAAVDVMSFDAACAARYGTLAAELAHRGEPIGDFDALIAAHALNIGATLVTNNTKHFQRIRGLRIVNWL